MRVLLFDWAVAGHREVYLRSLVDALRPAEAVLAIPDDLAERVNDLDVHVIGLGAERPVIDESRHFSREKRSAGRAELAMFRHVLRVARPDHALHLHADPVVRWLAGDRPFDVPISVLLFRPRAHYPRLYGSKLTTRELLAAGALEIIVRRWRRRRDANAVLTLDEGAALVWQSSSGAPAHWLPEPPVLANPSERPRSGCAIFGALAARKGVDLLARAVALAPTDLVVTLAGVPDSSYRETLGHHAETMRGAGARVEVRDWWHTEESKLDVLLGAKCIVVPYPRHYGMSRALVEAAWVGTPVVAHDFGLVGHLVRRYGIGMAVDCNSPELLRRAILSFVEGEDSTSRREALRSFAGRYSRDAFRAAVAKAFRIPASTR